METDRSQSRGREVFGFSYGRGGAGNIRSPSRDPTSPLAQSVNKEEDTVIRAHNAAIADGPFSSGRGGAGNINATRSRSRGPNLVHSTGRGGAGNILSGSSEETVVVELKDDAERKVHHGHGHDAGVHSTGRGGAANITATPDPPVEHLAHAHPHGEFESSGRGGAGNIVRHS
ncbi:hypothetical protein H0H93_003418 [Arthromyces matolae]|nr:hypothetical protein H0H93_003418 [Arthromyces matolae]